MISAPLIKIDERPFYLMGRFKPSTHRLLSIYLVRCCFRATTFAFWLSSSLPWAKGFRPKQTLDAKVHAL